MWRFNERAANIFINISNYHWSKGLRESSRPDELRKKWEKFSNTAFPEVDAFEQVQGFSVDLIWFHNLGLITSVPDTESEPNYNHGRILYACLRRYLKETGKGSVITVDVGTARGFSALCMCKAFEDSGRYGSIISVDVLPHLKEIYWNNVSDTEGQRTRNELLREYCHLFEGRVVFATATSSRIFSQLSFPRIHFAYLDGEHIYAAVSKELASIVPRQKKDDMILFDDCTETKFPGVAKAVQELDNYQVRIIPIESGYEMVLAKKQ